MCHHPGDDFHSDLCLATSNDTQLYWRYNGTDIIAINQYIEFGLNQHQGYDEDGRLYRSVTAYDVQFPFSLSCFEREKEILSYFIEIRDTCDQGLYVVIIPF